ncbi:MAG: heat shock protein [Phycisphaerales bacterium]|nr:heat shock protein [Phycisphaerales bacterium]
MSLVRRKRRGDRNEGGTLARRGPDDTGIAAMPDFGRQIDRVFDRLWRNLDVDPLEALATLAAPLAAPLADWPAIDIAEDDNALTVRVDLPGINPDEIDIQVSGNVLTISGTREDEWRENDRGVRRRERVVGTFTRTITLPNYVDPSRVEAAYDRGTLTITIPRIAGQGPKRVQVSSAQQGGDGSKGQGAGQAQGAAQGQGAARGGRASAQTQQGGAQPQTATQPQGGARP